MRYSSMFAIGCLLLAGCSSSSSSSTGGTGSDAVCGDGAVTAPETCDDGNVVTETCAYGESACEVCDGTCRLVAGATSSCGDGVVDGAAGETCDDSNALTETCAYGESACEVCNDACQRTAGATSYCGDGAVDDAAGEACDDGNTETEACAYGEMACSVCGPDCSMGPGVPNFCGDGVVDPVHGEACDDGNDVDGDGCDTICVPSGCGNGVIAGAEECDDGNLINDDGCDVSCRQSGCGSGIVTGDELCDDGNLVEGDGCDSNCTPTACGNGVLALGEGCDDGNQVTELCDYGTVSCVSCNAVCQLVTLSGSYCGDGFVDAANSEDCDDGNNLDGDGCEDNCKFACGAGTGTTSAFLTSTGCYLYFDGSASWATAESNCQALGFSLASTHAAFDHPVFAAIAAQALSDLWIGFNDETSEGTFVWSDGTPANFSDWAPGEPNNAGNEDCAVLTTASTWNDTSCYNFYGYICGQSTCGNGVVDPNEECDDGNYIDGDGCDSSCRVTGCGSGAVTAGEDCDDGNLLNGDGCESNCQLICGVGSGASGAYLSGGHCYLPFSTAADANTAEANCAALGGHLASIQDATENALVLKALQRSGLIGLTDALVEGSFGWTTGEQLTYTNWEAGEPNNAGVGEDCAEINFPGGRWNDVPCTFALPYVCEL